MGMFSSDFWEDYYGNNNGANIDPEIKLRMAHKNLETEGGYRAKISGNIGELNISSVLGSLPDYYHIIDNVLLQTKKGSTQIDHIIVSPFGIFIIETKNHKGMIFGDCFGQVWTQVLTNGGHFKMYSPVLQNQGHILNLSKQTRIPINYMQGVIVFTNPAANLDNVNCQFCFNTSALYDYIMQFDMQILTEKQMISAIKRIDAINTDGYVNRKKHINYVNEIKNRRGY